MNERAAPLFFVKGGANSFAAANLFPTGERIIILINSTDTAAAAAAGQSCIAGEGGGGLPFFRSFLSFLSLSLSFPFHGGCKSSSSFLRLLPLYSSGNAAVA